MSAGPESRIEIKIDSSWSSTWSVKCRTCRRTLGREIGGGDADLIVKLATTHECPLQYPEAEGCHLMPDRFA